MWGDYLRALVTLQQLTIIEWRGKEFHIPESFFQPDEFRQPAFYALWILRVRCEILLMWSIQCEANLL